MKFSTIWSGLVFASLFAHAAIAQPDAAPWPAVKEGLLVAFQTAHQEIFAVGDDGEPLFGYALEPHGKARTDAHGRLLLREGSYRAPHIGKNIANSIMKHGAFTIEARLHSFDKDQTGAAMSLSGDYAQPDLVLRQSDGVWNLVVGVKARPHITLKLFPVTGSPDHVAVTYDGSTLTVYNDGKPVSKSPLGADPGIWSGRFLEIGGVPGGAGAWAGALEGVAMYDRALTDDEVRLNTEAYHRLLDERKPVPQVRIEGKLIRKSHVPEPDEIAPYNRSLSVFEYEVLNVLEGNYGEPTIYVVHWGVLGGKQVAFKDAQVGRNYTMRLEPFNAHPQLETENFWDDAVEDFSLPLYCDAGGLSLGFDE